MNVKGQKGGQYAMVVSIYHKLLDKNNKGKKDITSPAET